jgi:hypothetical protein
LLDSFLDDDEDSILDDEDSFVDDGDSFLGDPAFMDDSLLDLLDEPPAACAPTNPGPSSGLPPAPNVDVVERFVAPPEPSES